MKDVAVPARESCAYNMIKQTGQVYFIALMPFSQKGWSTSKPQLHSVESHVVLRGRKSRFGDENADDSQTSYKDKCTDKRVHYVAVITQVAAWFVRTSCAVFRYCRIICEQC